MSAKLLIQYLMCVFRLVSYTCQNVISQGLPIFGSFRKLLRNLLKIGKSRQRNLLKIGKSRQIEFLYKCQISDSLFDVWFPTCQLHLLKCEVTRAPNFQKVWQTSEEFCNKNIPVVFTASSNNGGLQGWFEFFDS